MAEERQLSALEQEDLCSAVFHVSNPMTELINSLVHHYNREETAAASSAASVGFIIRTDATNCHLQIIVDRLERILAMVRQLNEEPCLSSHPFVAHSLSFVHHQSREVAIASVYCFPLKGSVGPGLVFLLRVMHFEINSELVGAQFTADSRSFQEKVSLNEVAEVEPGCYFFVQQLPSFVTAAADPLFDSCLPTEKMMRTYVSILPFCFNDHELKAIFSALFLNDSPLGETLRRLVGFHLNPTSSHLLLSFYITVKDSRLEVRVVRRSILGLKSAVDFMSTKFRRIEAFNYCLSALKVPTSHLFYLDSNRNKLDASIIPFNQRKVHIELSLGVLLNGVKPLSAQCNAHRQVMLANGRPLELVTGSMVHSDNNDNPLVLTIVPGPAETPVVLTPIIFNYDDKTLFEFPKTHDDSDDV